MGRVGGKICGGVGCHPSIRQPNGRAGLVVGWGLCVWFWCAGWGSVSGSRYSLVVLLARVVVGVVAVSGRLRSWAW